MWAVGGRRPPQFTRLLLEGVAPRRLLPSHARHCPPRSFCHMRGPRAVRGPLGAHSRDPAPQRTRPAGRRGPGPGHPVPTGAGAQTGGASRRLRETLLAGDPGPPSATGPQVPAIPLWAKARSRPGNTECVPRRGLDWPLSSRSVPSAAVGGGQPGWVPLLAEPPKPPPSPASLCHLN